MNMLTDTGVFGDFHSRAGSLPRTIQTADRRAFRPNAQTSDDAAAGA